MLADVGWFQLERLGDLALLQVSFILGEGSPDMFSWWGQRWKRAIKHQQALLKLLCVSYLLTFINHMMNSESSGGETRSSFLGGEFQSHIKRVWIQGRGENGGPSCIHLTQGPKSYHYLLWDGPLHIGRKYVGLRRVNFYFLPSKNHQLYKILPVQRLIIRQTMQWISEKKYLHLWSSSAGWRAVKECTVSNQGPSMQGALGSALDGAWVPPPLFNSLSESGDCPTGLPKARDTGLKVS